MVIFHSYVSLPKGIFNRKLSTIFQAALLWTDFLGDDHFEFAGGSQKKCAAGCCQLPGWGQETDTNSTRPGKHTKKLLKITILMGTSTRISTINGNVQ